MKVYYILSVLSNEEKDFFFDSIKLLNNPTDIDEIIKTKYYRVNKETIGTTYNSIILETWIFIKTIWEKFWIHPKDINWVYKQNMVIINEDLFLFQNNEWKKVSWEESIYFFTSRYWFNNIFWSLWEEIASKNKFFPKIIFPNKDLRVFKNSNDKIKYIINIYNKREKIVWNFMLPLMYSRNIQSIWSLLLLWKDITWEDFVLVKKSCGTDNWKHITLLNINNYLNNDQMLEYIYFKYISSISEFDTNIYITSFYEIDKEFRLYYVKSKWKYKLYSAKQKINLTNQDDLQFKTSLSTWKNLIVKWDLYDLNDIPEKVKELSEYIFKKNNIDVGVIEFVKLKWKSEYRFLEINCLWWSMMFEWQDEINIKNMISSWWNELYIKEIK